MKVRQLVGRFAGCIIDMPFHVAQACLSNGTAALPDGVLPKVRGLKIRDDIEDVAPNRMITTAQIETRAPKARRKK